MVWVKADTGLENTYRKLIHTSKADVDWNGSILIKIRKASPGTM